MSIEVYTVEAERGIVVAQRGGTAEALILNIHEVSYWNGENILKLFMVMIAQLGKFIF